MTKIIFLRHAETKVDKNKPVSEWELSNKGESQAEELAEKEVFRDVDVVVTSEEKKAYQTAKPIAKKLDKRIVQHEDLNELDRDGGGFLEKEEFDKTVEFCMKNLDESRHNWETAEHALERFSEKIEEIKEKYEDKKILIVSHGIVINLYFAKLLGELDKVWERTLNNSFCDFGMIEGREVVKDVS